MIVVAGHVCLDVIPAIPAGAALEPGALVEVGGASFSSGGAVANVGISLARLGQETALVGRIGDDPFGDILRAELRRAGAGARDIASSLATVAGEATSYSIVINRPSRDRTFLHHAGCNDTFSAVDLAPERWAHAELLHFGYPPLMKAVYRDGGAELAAAFARLREQGVAVSLDMAMPDPGGPSGKVDWPSFLARVLPHVDLFLPSWEEISFMLEPGCARNAPEPELLASCAERLLAAGVAVAGLKLGDQGLYLRTADTARLARAGRLAPPPDWAERELLSPNYKVATRSATGAGDATIAGLLAALAQRLPIEEAASMASAVGACSVEGIDAVGGVRSWPETRERVERGWPRAESTVVTPVTRGWRLHGPAGAWLGPSDRGGNQ